MTSPAQEAAAFISYSREDSEFALRLARDLKAAGINVWLDQLDIEAGHEWDNAIEGALTQAPRMILILSPASAASRNVRNEVAVALDEGKMIVPILYRDCTVPLQLRRIQHIDFRADYALGFSALLKQIGVQPPGEFKPAAFVTPLPVQPKAPVATKVPERLPREEKLPPQPAGPWAMRKLRQFWVLIPLVAILIALIVSDLGDFMRYLPFAENPCGLTEIDQSSFSARTSLRLAELAFRYTPTPSVAIVYVNPASDPADLLTNVCASRVFLARLITDLNALNARLIVIDKFYSAGACAEQDKNAIFVKAMESSKVPLVVGQQTHPLEDNSKVAGCLALTKRLEFSKLSKVLYGLTRLNSDDLKIPLRWPVFSESAAGQTTAPAPAQLPDASGDTLSLVAAKVIDPNIETYPTLQELLAAHHHPYTTFVNLPNITALTALCSAEPGPRAPIGGVDGDDMCKQWGHPLDNLDGHQLNLANKIVVIGDLVDQDMQPFPTDLAPFPPKQRPGVFLQANYVQSLLDHRFLLEAPIWLTATCLLLFGIGVYCLYWSHNKEGQPYLSARQAGIASVVLLAVMVVVSLLALLGLSYFTPLWALWAAIVFVVFRYLAVQQHPAIDVPPPANKP